VSTPRAPLAHNPTPFPHLCASQAWEGAWNALSGSNAAMPVGGPFGVSAGTCVLRCLLFHHHYGFGHHRCRRSACRGEADGDTDFDRMYWTIIDSDMIPVRNVMAIAMSTNLPVWSSSNVEEDVYATQPGREDNDDSIGGGTAVLPGWQTTHAW